MERVTFLLEKTGERLGCLLNPASLVMQRAAGVRPRRSLGGALTGAGLADDPLLCTGGGSTEWSLDLLFDVTVAGSSIETEDVRELTAPLWALAENTTDVLGSGPARPPTVRFLWGKTWNLPGIVTAVAERFEQFTDGGAPRRSWLRMRLRRVAEPPAPLEPDAPADIEFPDVDMLGEEEADWLSEAAMVHEIIGGDSGQEDDSGVAGERLDELAQRYYGDPSLWRLLAAVNDVDDPMRLSSGVQLQVPPLADFQ
jgi:hypothetical protein